MSLTKQACSLVQVGLQSNGYHTNTTFFLPAKSESFTSFLSWFCSAKSGAVCPTAIAMFFPPSGIELSHHLIEYSQPRQTDRSLHRHAAQFRCTLVQEICRRR